MDKKMLRLNAGMKFLNLIEFKQDQLTSVNSKTKFLYHMLLIYFYFVLDALIAWTSHTKKVTIATAKVIAKLLLKVSLFEDLSTANNILCFNLSKILRESRHQYCYS